MHRMSFLFFVILFILTGCYVKEPNNVGYQSYLTQTFVIQEGNFTLEVTTPVTTKTGDTILIEQKLTYSGTEDLMINHRDPIIRSTILNENDEEIDTGITYVDHLLSTTFKQGQSYELKEEYILQESGDYEIHTSALFGPSDDVEPYEMIIDPINMYVSD